jgi:hypothetical protein
MKESCDPASTHSSNPQSSNDSSHRRQMERTATHHLLPSHSSPQTQCYLQPCPTHCPFQILPDNPLILSTQRKPRNFWTYPRCSCVEGIRPCLCRLVSFLKITARRLLLFFLHFRLLLESERELC